MNFGACVTQVAQIPWLVHTNADPTQEGKDVVVADTAMILRYIVNTFGKRPEGHPNVMPVRWLC